MTTIGSSGCCSWSAEACLALLAGLHVAGRSPWGGAALIALGAVAGAVATFWSIVAPVAATVLIVLAVWWPRARRSAL